MEIKMKNNKGISIISFILTILIIVVISFLGYQIFYEDILEMQEDILGSKDENINNSNYQNISTISDNNLRF